MISLFLLFCLFGGVFVVVSQQIKLSCFCLETQKPGLGEGDSEPSLKRVSATLTGWGQEERTQQKTSHMIQCGLTNENLAIREVDQCVLNLKRDQTNSQTSYSLA